ncbi:hypothetical protein F2Q69_00031531 [Brassica cretica]|uniref:Uncharacterized protein n=1 Tax=Brassica cretica TaxID=69181 RepID=A0A8S9RUE8_BRACR|nr:hypothetical protein F2Q69_00031531 [Brassica cretica]
MEGVSIGWVTHGFTHSKQTWVDDGHTQITYGLTGLKIHFAHGLTAKSRRKSISASRFVFSGFDSLNPNQISLFSTSSSRDFSDCYDQLLKHWPNVYLALENNLEIVPVSTGDEPVEKTEEEKEEDDKEKEKEEESGKSIDFN